jgi:hypothetical protein
LLDGNRLDFIMALDEFLSYEGGALLRALLASGPEDHPVRQVEDKDGGLVLVGVRW